jgi:adenylate cyclase
MRRTLFLGVGVAATVLALGAHEVEALRSAERATVDARFAVRGTQPAPRDLVVVKIDDRTFDELETQWPFPRSFHGRVIDRIMRDRPRSIGYDIQFTEPTTPADDSEEAAIRAAEEDNALIEAVARARGRVVLAATEVDEQGGTRVFGGEDVLRQIGARAANALLRTDRGLVIRQVPYEIGRLETFGIATAEVALGREIPRSALPENPAWIDYLGPPGTVRSVSFSSVMRGQVPRGTFRNAVVIVGPEAATLQDLHPTSTSGDVWMSGAEIQANVVSTALRGFPLASVGSNVDRALIALLGLLVPLVSMRLRPRYWVALALAATAAYLVGAQIAFEQGTIVSVVYPLGALGLAAVGTLGMHYLVEAFERERLRDLFGRFVSEPVVDHVLERTGAELRLGGERVVGTVMFTDLRGFTTFSENLPADQVIEALNRYLTEMSAAILDHGGTLICYMGDGIFAVFGAPIEQPDHADRALAASREMLEQRLPRFNAWLREQGYDQEFQMGIGLNSGPFMSGNVGSERRLEYAAIGDTTNTASRLEGMTKGSGHSLFVSESTREALEDARDLVFVDEVEIRGRKNTVRLWSLGNGNGARPSA